MNKTAILDMDSILYTIGHPNKVLDEFGTPLRTEDGSKFIYTEKTELKLAASADFIMNQILNKCGCDSYIGFIKGVNTIGSKLKYNPDYKQDRTSEQPKWWNKVKNYLKHHYNVHLANNFEVDEYVVGLHKVLPDSFIVAIDSDIIGTKGTHYNWKKNDWTTTTYEEEIYNFWSQMITGNHNNVTGLKGKGIKYFERLFNLHIKNKAYTELYLTTIITEYTTYYGETKGLEEFYKTYFSLLFIMPTNINDYKPIEWKQNTIEDINYGIE